MPKVRIEVAHELVGQSFVFNENNLGNFQTIYDLVSEGESCSAQLEYSGDVYKGAVAVSNGSIVISFAGKVITPPGVCIEIECKEKEITEDTINCKNQQYDVSNDVKLAILDEDGCLKGWVRLGDIFPEVVHPDTLCKLYKISQVPQGNLTASDRILTVDDSCMIKSIPATDIVCGDT